MTKLLENKVVLVTGGAFGIGRATALAMAREGATVVVADVQTAEGETTEGETTARLIQNAGGTARFVRCDVARGVEVSALVQTTVEAYGRLDCAFNNAGIEGEVAPTAECTEDNWDRVLAVDLKGVWLCMKYEIQQMLKQGKGAIVNTASVAGMVAERGFPAYAAAKGGVVQLTRTAAIEYATTGLRVNAVCPGGILTPMIDRALSKLSVNTLAPGVVKSPLAQNVINKLMGTRPVRNLILNMMHPMGRPGQPEEIAEAVVFLCSDGASFITGNVMMIDGGMTAA